MILLTYVKLSVIAEQYLGFPDSLQAKQDSVFERSNFTREQFNDFREQINNEPEKWNPIWKKIVDRLSLASQQHQDSTTIKIKS